MPGRCPVLSELEDNRPPNVRRTAAFVARVVLAAVSQEGGSVDTIKRMAKKTSSKASTSSRRGDPVSLAPLTPEQALRGMFQIKPADVARIVASKPGAKRKRAPKRKP